MQLKMSKNRLNLIVDGKNLGIMQRVIKAGKEYKIACYHPIIQCKDRQVDSFNEKICPCLECNKRGY